MKTTVDIADPILEQAKRQAASDQVTLKLLMEEGLRMVLDSRRREKASFKLKPLTTVGGGLAPEFRDAGWDKIRDAIYE